MTTVRFCVSLNAATGRTSGTASRLRSRLGAAVLRGHGHTDGESRLEVASGARHVPGKGAAVPEDVSVAEADAVEPAAVLLAVRWCVPLEPQAPGFPTALGGWGKGTTVRAGSIVGWSVVFVPQTLDGGARRVVSSPRFGAGPPHAKVGEDHLIVPLAAAPLR